MSVVRLVVAIAALMIACDGGGSGASEDADGSGQPYVTLADEAWPLQEAIDPVPDAPLTALERPPLLWLSGHDATLARTRSELEALGFAFGDVPVDGWRAVGGETPDGSGASIVVLDNGPTSLMVLSHEIGVEELADLAAHVDRVDQAAWVAAGGVVR